MTALQHCVLAIALTLAAGRKAALAQIHATEPAPVSSSLLFHLKDSDIKFHVEDLMRMLRDHRHEGWVLAAYPDPKTSRPLIGAGFSLDLSARGHSQLDPLNPHPFLEPSSAELWQAAGLEPARLQRILEQFQLDFEKWGKKGYRRRIRSHSLVPQVTEEDATKLLRISSIQAISNARAYCRDFDRLSASQQMAFSQLVFQMGVNLGEFVDFLTTVNGGGAPDASIAASVSGTPAETLLLRGPQDEAPADHWQDVQHKLMNSEWARRYASRASAVIAMFDPEYDRNPTIAERRITAVLHPRNKTRRRRQSKAFRTSPKQGVSHHQRRPAKAT